MPASGASSAPSQIFTLRPGQTLRDVPERHLFFWELLRRTDNISSTDVPLTFQVPNAELTTGAYRVIPDSSPPPDGANGYPRLHRLKLPTTEEEIWFTLGLEHDQRAQPLTPNTHIFRPAAGRPRLLLVFDNKYLVFRLSCGGFLVLTTVDCVHDPAARPWTDVYQKDANFAWFTFENAFAPIAYGLYEPPAYPTELRSIGWDHQTYSARALGLDEVLEQPDFVETVEEHFAVLFPPVTRLKEPLLEPRYATDDELPDPRVEWHNERDQRKLGELVQDTPDEWTTASRQALALEQFNLLWHYERQLLGALVETRVFDSPEAYDLPRDQLLRCHERAYNRALWCCWKAEPDRVLVPAGGEPGRRGVQRVLRGLESWRAGGPPASVVQPLVSATWEQERFEELLVYLTEHGCHEPLEPPVYIRRPLLHATAAEGLGKPDFAFRPYTRLKQEPRHGPPRPELEPPAPVSQHVGPEHGDGPFDSFEDDEEAQRLRTLVRTLRDLRGERPFFTAHVTWSRGRLGGYVRHVSYQLARRDVVPAVLVIVQGHQGAIKPQVKVHTNADGLQQHLVDIDAVVRLLLTAQPPGTNAPPSEGQ